jgi:sugar transferase (PEP-CTERM system associated)
MPYVEADQMFAPFGVRYALVSLVELLLMAGVFSAAFLFVLYTKHPTFSEQMATALVAHLTFALSLLLPAGACGLHRFDQAEQLRPFAGKFLISMTVGGLLCYLTFALLPAITPYRASVPDAVLVGALGLAVVRGLLSHAARFKALSHPVLVIGTGPDALLAEVALSRGRKAGFSVAGFYETDASGAPAVAAARVIPSSEPLDAVIKRLRIREIVVAVRDQRGGKIPLADLLNCRLQGVPVTDLVGLFERVSGTVHLESLKASWLIYGRGFHQGWARRTVKRTFDILAASMLLVCAAPIVVITALAIWLESGRPVVLRQERIGLAGRTFPLLKFRSMRLDAEKDGVPRWAQTGDPRVTRIGRLIRRSRIDELPQIFNILKGEMSFVGPRPERPYFVAQLATEVPFYEVRHAVKPGLTGWAQVSYSYGASVEDAVRKLEYDLYYVKNHSLLFDLVILLKTVRVVLVGEGAR